MVSFRKWSKKRRGESILKDDVRRGKGRKLFKGSRPEEEEKKAFYGVCTAYGVARSFAERGEE